MNLAALWCIAWSKVASWPCRYSMTAESLLAWYTCMISCAQVPRDACIFVAHTFVAQTFVAQAGAPVSACSNCLRVDLCSVQTQTGANRGQEGGVARFCGTNGVRL